MLSTEGYRDNNNYLQINKGDHYDERFNLFSPDKSFFYVDYISGPVREKSNFQNFDNRSYDGVNTFDP